MRPNFKTKKSLFNDGGGWYGRLGLAQFLHAKVTGVLLAPGFRRG
jgi:hypothetical protein